VLPHGKGRENGYCTLNGWFVSEARFAYVSWLSGLCWWISISFRSWLYPLTTVTGNTSLLTGRNETETYETSCLLQSSIKALVVSHFITRKLLLRVGDKYNLQISDDGFLCDIIWKGNSIVTKALKGVNIASNKLYAHQLIRVCALFTCRFQEVIM
jgi:hypothetical protein